jgi:hypothetical protein
MFISQVPSILVSSMTSQKGCLSFQVTTYYLQQFHKKFANISTQSWRELRDMVGVKLEWMKETPENDKKTIPCYTSILRKGKLWWNQRG